MKTFAQFAEGWDSRDRKFFDNKGDMHHHAEIHGHDVNIHFGHQRDHSYHIDYHIDGEHVNAGVEDQHKHAILHHVHKTIDRFIRHRKPSSIIMTAYDSTRHSLYKKFAQKIAKKHGGKPWHDDITRNGGYSGVHFPLREAVEKTITAHSAGVEHKFDVGPHRVHVRFSQHKPGEYTANFRVNGSMEKYDNPNIKPAHRQAIVHHVVGSVKQFVKSHKPTSLRASGNTAKKQLLYHKLWHHIAKNHPDYEAHSHGLKRINEDA